MSEDIATFLILCIFSKLNIYTYVPVGPHRRRKRTSAEDSNATLVFQSGTTAHNPGVALGAHEMTCYRKARRKMLRDKAEEVKKSMIQVEGSCWGSLLKPDWLASRSRRMETVGSDYEADLSTIQDGGTHGEQRG
ncbi:hypothetical protein MKZ38_007539 [Zalerion maritima]|uniref:Uncharacterized protein n=1 Tax=Zalerion maritima TaxID=339359 RepID=A0AAD5RHT8_9PEZI|nr:hypothetical protein MKZ38_007539 [Zalerion maritima]